MSRQFRSRIKFQQNHPASSPIDDPQPTTPTADSPPSFLSLRLKASKRMRKLFASHREQRQSLLQPKDSLAEARKSVSSSMLEPSDAIRTSLQIADDTPFKSSAVDVTLQPAPSHAAISVVQSGKSRQLGAIQTRTPGQPCTPVVTASSSLAEGASTPAQPGPGSSTYLEQLSPSNSPVAMHSSTPRTIPLVEIEMPAQVATHSLLKPPSLDENEISGRDSGYGSNGSGSNNTSPLSEEPPLATTTPPNPSPSNPSLLLPGVVAQLTNSPEQSPTPLLPDDSTNNASITSKKPQLPPLSTFSSPSGTPRMPTSPASGIRPSPAGKTHLRLRLDSLSHPLPVLPPTPKSSLIPSTPYPPGAFQIPPPYHAKAISEPASVASSPIVNDATLVGPPSPSTVRSPGPSRPALGLLRLSTRRIPAPVVDDQPTSPSVTRLPREARASVPALRRDGSFFYTVAPSEDSHVGSSEEQEPSESESDDAGEEDEEERPSDDEETQQIPLKLQVVTPLLRSLSTGLKAIAGIASPSSQSSTPVQSHSPSLTPIATTRSMLVASGTPGLSLTTMPEDHVGEADNTTSSHSRVPAVTQASPTIAVATPRVRPRPQQISLVQQKLTDPAGDDGEGTGSNRETIYLTPMHTPTENETGANRESVYFDAEDRGEDEEEDVDQLVNDGQPSAFTTVGVDFEDSMAALATPRAYRADIPGVSTPTSLATPIGTAPPNGAMVPPRSDNLSTPRQTLKRADFSALGLDLSNTSNWRHSDGVQGIVRRETSASQSWDYFSIRGTASPHAPADAGEGLAPNSSPNHTLSFKATPRTPLSSLLRTPKTPGGRPTIYSQVSHSMIDFGSIRVVDESQQSPKMANAASPKGKERASDGSEGDDPPSHLEEINGTVSPANSSIKSPPPPFMSTLTRRMSLPNLSELPAAAPPPPYPKTGVPREEEGREVLPPYKCGIHFEASMPRKMEFSAPGVLAKDRGWKRVYVVLSGTGLWIYRQDPRRWCVKAHHSFSHHGQSDATAGGKRGDGVVDVDDLLVDAPHVHLPLEVLQAHATTRPGPLKRTTSRGSSSGGSTSNLSGTTGSRLSTSRRSGDGTVGSTLSMINVVASGAVGIAASTTSLNRPPSSFQTRSQNPASTSTFTLTTATNTEDETSPINEKVPFPPDPAPSNKKQNKTDASAKHLPFHSQSGSSILANFQQNVVLRNYSMQNAETGIASDYHKKKNVIRVRIQGEQFLLQADSINMAVSWIETFQAASNVSLDLDVRPMPKLPAFPRRRRRRRPQNATTTEGADNRNSNIPPEPTTDTGTPQPEPDNTDNPPPSADSRHTRFSFGRRYD